MNFFRRFRDAAVCVALLAIPFFFLRANLKQPSQMTPLDRTLLQVSGPIQYAATKLASGVGGLIQEYVFLIEVQRDNDRLRSENSHLREENRAMRTDIADNRNLHRLLQLREEVKGTLVSAQVIAKPINSNFRVDRVRLDRGEQNRVREGMPVLTPDGLVGQIHRTSGAYSDVMLVSDKNSAIDVIVERTGARGILRGIGSDRNYVCRIEHLEREADVKPGDVLLTSGLGRSFPASIVVGTIETVNKPEFGLYQQATVTPAIKYSRLREVMIMLAGPRLQFARASSTGPEKER